MTELDQVLEERARAIGEIAYMKARGGAMGVLHRNKYLYFVLCGDAVKIGVSADPGARIKSLQTGAPGPLVLLASVKGAGGRENECHAKLAHLKIHGEWFRYTEEVDTLIKGLS